MSDNFNLIEYCNKCEYGCCSTRIGSPPRIYPDEKEAIVKATGKDRFVEEDGYYVPVKDDTGCVYLDNGLCGIHDAKPVDCKIYPIDPVYNEDGNLDWVIDASCPASSHITPHFYANSIFVGMNWVKKTNPGVLLHYWKKYKESNKNQVYVKLSDYLESAPKEFKIKIKDELQRLVGTDLKEWLEENKSIDSLGFILCAEN